jgi:hypothetical protein
MKVIFQALAFNIVILLAVFITGTLVPFLFSAFIAITTEKTLSMCVDTSLFWVFTVIGNGCAAICINSQLKSVKI